MATAMTAAMPVRSVMPPAIAATSAVAAATKAAMDPVRSAITLPRERRA